MLDQSYPKIEVVIVDDGVHRRHAGCNRYSSKIGSPPCARSSPGRQRRATPGSPRRKATSSPFSNSDDIWERSKTALQVDLLLSRPDLSVCLCEVQNFWSPEITVPEGADFPNGADPVSGWFAQSMMIRRSAFDAAGLFDATLRHREAMEWLRRASDAGLKVEIVQQVLVRRRLHLTNRSRSRAGDDHKALLKIAQEAMLRRRMKQR